MTYAQELGWTRSSSEWLPGLKSDQAAVASGRGLKFDYYSFPRGAFCYATSCYLEGNIKGSAKAARLVVNATLEYFYGDWRKRLPAPSGKADPEEWRKCCLWHEVVVESLPWACALRDWKAVKRIAVYPIDDSFPEAARVRGETAWTRALICFLRGEPRVNVESFLAKAEQHKSQRPKIPRSSSPRVARRGWRGIRENAACLLGALP